MKHCAWLCASESLGHGIPDLKVAVDAGHPVVIGIGVAAPTIEQRHVRADHFGRVNAGNRFACPSMD